MKYDVIYDSANEIVTYGDGIAYSVTYEDPPPSFIAGMETIDDDWKDMFGADGEIDEG